MARIFITGSADGLGQAWLAVGEDRATHVSGQYFYHQREQAASPRARSPQAQDALLDYCAELAGTALPDV
jgi:hypothetical protein